jgi:hypothetical protein
LPTERAKEKAPAFIAGQLPAGHFKPFAHHPIDARFTVDKSILSVE